MWQSVKEYLPAVWKRWRALVISLVGIIGIIINIWQELAVPIWVWVAIIIVGLFIAQFLAFHKLREQQAKPPKNWIEAYKSRHGKLPLVPKYLRPVCEFHPIDQPVSKDMELKTPSGQLWSSWNPTQRGEWRQLVEWCGKNPEDYLAEMKRMSLRKSPNGAGRWNTPKQG